MYVCIYMYMYVCVCMCVCVCVCVQCVLPYVNELAIFKDFSAPLVGVLKCVIEGQLKAIWGHLDDCLHFCLVAIFPSGCYDNYVSRYPVHWFLFLGDPYMYAGKWGGGICAALGSLGQPGPCDISGPSVEVPWCNRFLHDQISHTTHKYIHTTLLPTSHSHLPPPT